MTQRQLAKVASVTHAKALWSSLWMTEMAMREVFPVPDCA